MAKAVQIDVSDIEGNCEWCGHEAFTHVNRGKFAWTACSLNDCTCMHLLGFLEEVTRKIAEAEGIDTENQIPVVIDDKHGKRTVWIDPVSNIPPTEEEKNAVFALLKKAAGDGWRE